jgi:hypothetical protein
MTYFDRFAENSHFSGQVIVLRVHGFHLLPDLVTGMVILHGPDAQFLFQLTHQHGLFLVKQINKTNPTEIK